MGKSLVALVWSVVSWHAAGQTGAAFPTKPVRLVVAFPIAGATDILARQFAQKLAEQLGYQVIVDNRPGAGGTIGSRIVAGAAADGYTLTMGTTSTHAIGPHLYSSKPYDPVTDFTPVTQMCTSPTVLMAAMQVPAKSLKELIALAKAQPGKINFGSSGIGTQFHLSGELLKLLAGINIVHVPYKGTALVYPDMISGQIQNKKIFATDFTDEHRFTPTAVILAQAGMTIDGVNLRKSVKSVAKVFVFDTLSLEEIL